MLTMKPKPFIEMLRQGLSQAFSTFSSGSILFLEKIYGIVISDLRNYADETLQLYWSIHKLAGERHYANFSYIFSDKSIKIFV